MRSGLLLSVILHTAAIGSAAVIGGIAVVRHPRVAPHVELQSVPPGDVASSSPVAPPQVVAEPTLEVLATIESPIDEEPLPPPEPAPQADLAPPPEIEVPWRERVVSRAQAAVVAPTTEPPASVAPPVAVPSARVEAMPLADNHPPEYPANERALGREGDVLVRVELDERGDVIDVALARPSPWAGLNRAALRAVRKWRFTPAVEGGLPVASELEVPVVFRLVEP